MLASLMFVIVTGIILLFTSRSAVIYASDTVFTASILILFVLLTLIAFGNMLRRAIKNKDKLKILWLTCLIIATILTSASRLPIYIPEYRAKYNSAEENAEFCHKIQRYILSAVRTYNHMEPNKMDTLDLALLIKKGYISNYPVCSRLNPYVFVGKNLTSPNYQIFCLEHGNAIEPGPKRNIKLNEYQQERYDLYEETRMQKISRYRNLFYIFCFIVVIIFYMFMKYL